MGACNCISSKRNGELQTGTGGYGYDPDSFKELSKIILINFMYLSTLNY